MSATSECSVPWNTAADTMRMAALMNSADISAIDESSDGEADRFGLARVGVHVAARLHDRRVQIQVVGHHGRAQDAERDVEHRRVRQDLGARHEAQRHGRRVGLRQPDLDGEAAGDGHDERDDERLDVAESLVLQEQDHHHVERGQTYAPHERQSEEQVERDGGADHLGQVARGNRDLAQDPQADGDGPRVAVAAGLRQVAACCRCRAARPGPAAGWPSGSRAG